MQFDKDITGKFLELFLKLRTVIMGFEESFILNIEAVELKKLRKR